MARSPRDPNRHARIYGVERWDSAAAFAPIEYTDDLTATEANALVTPLRGTNTAYRIIVNPGRPYGINLCSVVAESLFHPQEGVIDAPVSAIQFDVYRERVDAR